MKKVFCILSFLFLTLICKSQDGLKIGYINSVELFHKEQIVFEQKMMELNSYFELVQNDYSRRIIDYNNNAHLMTQDENKRKEIELMDAYKQIEELRTTLQNQLKKTRDSLIGPLQDRVKFFIWDVGKKNNYDLIVDRDVLTIYCNEHLCDNLNTMYKKGQITGFASNYNPTIMSKIGYLDFQKFLEESDEFKEGILKLQKRISDSDNEFNILLTQLSQKKNNLQQNNYTENELITIINQIADEQRNIQMAYNERKIELETEQTELIKTVKEKCLQKVSDFAIENNFALIVDIAAIIYTSERCVDVYSPSSNIDGIDLTNNNGLKISILNSEDYISSQPIFVKKINQIQNDKAIRLAEIENIRAMIQSVYKEGNSDYFVELLQSNDSLTKADEYITNKQITDLMQSVVIKCRQKIGEIAPTYNIDILFDNKSGFIVYYNDKINQFPIMNVDN